MGCAGFYGLKPPRKKRGVQGAKPYNVLRGAEQRRDRLEIIVGVAYDVLGNAGHGAVVVVHSVAGHRHLDHIAGGAPGVIALGRSGAGDVEHLDGRAAVCRDVG